MNQQKLNVVEARIILLQEAMTALNERMKTEPSALYYGSKETGAVRRASLDLTRALAALRRPG